MTPTPVADIVGARILALFLDSITTDHISPAGSIKADEPGRPVSHRASGAAGRLQPVRHAARQSRSDDARHFRQYPHQEPDGEGRGGEVVEGGYTIHQPSGERMAIYDAAMRYQKERVPLVVFAGKEYGTGSSRDWAAKGTKLLGVRAVIAQSFERIHRSNLVGMGVLPLVFEEGTSWRTLGLKGDETVTIHGIARVLKPRQTLHAEIKSADGETYERAADLPHRHARRARIFPQRRHPALRAEAAGGVGGPTGSLERSAGRVSAVLVSVAPPPLWGRAGVGGRAELELRGLLRARSCPARGWRRRGSLGLVRRDPLP